MVRRERRGLAEQGAGPGPEFPEGGDGPGHGEVEFAVLYLLGAAVAGSDVGEAGSLAYGFDDFDLFADAIDEMKAGVGKEDGQWDAGEAAAGADVDDVRTWFDGEGGGDGQGVQDMFGVEAIDVFAGDDVDLCVPVFIQLAKCGQLLDLDRGEVRKILQDYFQVFRGFCHSVEEKMI